MILSGILFFIPVWLFQSGQSHPSIPWYHSRSSTSYHSLGYPIYPDNRWIISYRQWGRRWQMGDIRLYTGRALSTLERPANVRFPASHNPRILYKMHALLYFLSLKKKKKRCDVIKFCVILSFLVFWFFIYKFHSLILFHKGYFSFVTNNLENR